MSQGVTKSTSSNSHTDDLSDDDRLVQWSRQPCSDAAELRVVCTLLLQLKHKCASADDWQLSKVALAILHQVLSHVADLQSLMPALLDVLACALRVSPLAEANQLAAAITTCNVTTFCATLMLCLQSQQDTEPHCVVKMTEVVLSFVGAFHALLAAHTTLDYANYLAHATQLEAALQQILHTQSHTECTQGTTFEVTLDTHINVSQAWVATVLRYARSHTKSAWCVVRYLLQGIDLDTLHDSHSESNDEGLCKVDEVEGLRTRLVHPFVRNAFSSNYTDTSIGVMERQWRAVWELLWQSTRVTLRQSMQAIRDVWQAVVSPIVRRWLRHCPLSLVESFAQPPYDVTSEDGNGDEMRRSAIRHDVQVLFAHATSQQESNSEKSEDAVHALCTLYNLARVLATLSDDAIVLYVPSGDMCTHTLLPAVHAALRERRMREAIVLLQWTLHASCSDESTVSLHTRLTQWLHRLRNAQKIHVPANTLPRCPRQYVAGVIYRDVLARRDGIAGLDATTVLDLLVNAVITHETSNDTNNDMNELYIMRVVCDGALRVGQTHIIYEVWGKAILQDALALPFLLTALTYLVRHAFTVGDIALARVYHGWLGQCLLRCPSRLALHDFALALMFTVASRLRQGCGLSKAESEVWADMADAIDGCVNTSTTTTNASCVSDDLSPPRLAAAAFHARRNFFDSLCTTDDKDEEDTTTCTSHSPSTATAFTTVTVRSERGTSGMSMTDKVMFVRQRHGEANSPSSSSSQHDDDKLLWPPSEMRIASNATRLSLQGLVTGMAALVEANRAQLRQDNKFSDSNHITFHEMPEPHHQRSNNTNDEYMTQDERQPRLSLKARLSNTRDDIEKECKEIVRRQAWWAARCALDQRVADVVHVLESELGMWRLVLLGELALPLRLSLWQCSRCLMRDLHHIIHTNIQCETNSNDEEDCEEEVGVVQCYTLLHGLPYVALGHTSDNMEGTMEEMTCTTLPLLYKATVRYCAAEDTCASCAALVERTTTILTELLLNIIQGDTSVQTTLQVEVRAAFVQRCSRAVREVFDTFYDTLYADYNSVTTNANKEDIHVDLLQLPREHVYLVLGESEWHGLPWEGLDVLCRHSVSRVPSSDYVAHTLSQYLNNDTAKGVSLFDTERVLLYIDPSATAQRHKYERLLRAHAGWSVEYGPSQQTQGTLGSEYTNHSAMDVTLPAESALLRRMLAEQRGLLVYIGHRRGEELVSRAQLYERVPLYNACNTKKSCDEAQNTLLSSKAAHFPAVMLMSCSSAQTVGNAYCEPYGMPFAYLHAGAAFFLGCLWHVTDRDTDRLTRAFLRGLCGPQRHTVTRNAEEGREEEEEENSHTSRQVADGEKRKKRSERDTRCVVSVGESLVRARRACRLPHLSALASVMYGVNVCVAR